MDAIIKDEITVDTLYGTRPISGDSLITQENLRYLYYKNGYNSTDVPASEFNKIIDNETGVMITTPPHTKLGKIF